MDLWASTLGGGNSFSESVANTFTKGDGATYVGGTLYDDDSGMQITSTGGADDKYTGSANSTSTNNTDTSGTQINKIDGYVAGAYKDSSTLSTVAGSILNPISLFPKLAGGLMSWAAGIDPKTNEVLSGTMGANGKPLTVYAGGQGAKVKNYSYNFFNMPYEVVNVNGKWEDKLKQPVDPKTGAMLTATEIENGIKGITGYEYNKAQAFDSGDNESVTELEKLEADNSQEDDGTQEELSTVEQIKAWAKEAGLDLQNTDLEAIVADPKAWAESRNLKLEDLVPTLNADAEGTSLDGTDDKYSIGESDALNVNASTVSDISKVDEVQTKEALTYKASTNSDKLDASFDVNAATGKIDDDNLVDASSIETDINAAATGVNADGTTNEVGVAINDYATQKFSSIIDTSTVSGKNLAKALGEGNYVDEKATIAGQMKIISEQFVNSQGQAVIPKWAQKMARSVADTMAFDGITGSAQTSAMATAIMEATLGIAEKEATFFQTLTTKNLDNKQQQIINKANILSNFEVANLGARQAAAVQNAQSFLEMDLKNLDNEQQAEVINKQAKVQALFEDSKIINAQRLFTAEQTNDFNKFYDELNASIQKHNSSEINAMKKFNTGEVNDASEFNAELEDSRSRFYSNMQYNIDTANAKWRQEVTVKQFQATFDAITADVKNSLDLSTEAMSQLWDRAESLLDFVFRKDDSDANRTVTLLGSQLNAQAQQKGGNTWWEAALGVVGTLAGTKAGSEFILKGIKSDIRLKKNVRKVDTLKGINFYEWDWNDEGIRVGADQYPSFGVIAQEIQKTHPEAVVKGSDGYLQVNYEAVQHGLQ